MKNIKKNALKIMVMVALFAPAAFADGDMGGGGFADTGGITKSEKVVITQANEDGFRTTDPGYIGSFMRAIYDYLDSLI
jgi:hypothetical protein